MGFPCEGIEGAYRNQMSEVVRFFNKYHPHAFKVFNLCSERDYKPENFGGSCARFPFDDHNPCFFSQIFELCKSVKSFLDADPSHVVAIHCKAGKGRTGLMISSCLLYLYPDLFPTAQSALDYFSKYRVDHSKGVTIPSQIRWVYFFCRCLKSKDSQSMSTEGPPKPFVMLKRLILQPYADFDVSGGCDPYVKVKLMGSGEVIFNSLKSGNNKLRHWNKGDAPFAINMDDLVVRGEFLIQVYDHDKFGGDDKMLQTWLHTAFLPGTAGEGVFDLTIEKQDLDGANKDVHNKQFPENFSIKLEYDLDVPSNL
jgi:phosphatidylinositol-3,4,5-trisphosphate 3-phosphatase/dual-specificity protein phosphatase PTEN